MNLPYFAADTLGMTLYAVRAGLVANEIHQIAFGPWRVNLQIDVTSDLMNGTELGLWVTLGTQLPCYLVVREKENWLFVFDANVLKACGAKTGFSGDTFRARIKEFKPAIKAVFAWKGSGWEQMTFDVHIGA